MILLIIPGDGLNEANIYRTRASERPSKAKAIKLEGHKRVYAWLSKFQIRQCKTWGGFQSDVKQSKGNGKLGTDRRKSMPSMKNSTDENLP